MTLPAGCTPCPPVVSHAARHAAIRLHRAARHVTRPFHHPGRHLVRLALRHPGKIIVGVCCAGALGPIGGALTTPPAGLPAAIYTPPAAIAGSAPAWPEIPSYSGGYGIGPGGIYGVTPSVITAPGSNAPALIPVYGETPAPLPIPTQPGTVHFPPSSATHLTNVPEPASFALLLLPAGLVIAIRRRVA